MAPRGSTLHSILPGPTRERAAVWDAEEGSGGVIVFVRACFAHTPENMKPAYAGAIIAWRLVARLAVGSGGEITSPHSGLSTHQNQSSMPWPTVAPERAISMDGQVEAECPLCHQRNHFKGFLETKKTLLAMRAREIVQTPG
ncbi:MAG: hypothetical protein M1823_000554 [Watsoniomyces obsoletus]|nr:MAG: hypothetical protein M1823_000554 [Watsoniomyces obsoletus]